MAQQIEAVYQRASILRQRAMESPVQPSLLEAALGELAYVLEELQTSEEVLRTQNQDLITTRQHIETERRRYQTLFNLAPDGYLVTNPSGIIQEANITISSMLQVSQDYLIGKPLALLLTEADRPTLYLILELLKQSDLSALANLQGWEAQLLPRHQPPLDVAITLSLTSNPDSLENSYYWLLRDITQPKQIKGFLEQLNASLEQQVQARTTRLQQALDFEATLKRITDKIRDSLDEAQILQTVVQEIAEALEVSCCNTSQYDLNQQTALICYEYTYLDRSYKGRVISISDNREIYSQVLQHQVIQFCPLPAEPDCRKLVMMVVPILDDQGTLGDLWLVDQHSELIFTDQDVRLVQQIANQCTIAIRQARLHQKVQQQVYELEELHRLKDAFLSTVSHELRTPLSNINLSIGMLDLIVKQPEKFEDKQSRLVRYLEILKAECQREINLINDLLDFSLLDIEVQPLVPITILLQSWLPPVIASFKERMLQQQQHLQTDIPADLPPLETDKSLLTRILSELIHNACKYTPPGQIIRISCSTIQQALQISISNSGVSLPLPELEHLFEAFYRVPTHDPWKHGGTGLGLALVKKQVERLGAEITVTNQEDWMIFTLTLPLVQ